MVYLIFLTFVFASAARQARQPVPFSSRLRAPPPRFIGGVYSREGEFPQSICFIAMVVGYFACAQYDVLFFTCHCERAKRPQQSLGVKYGVYAAYFFRGIATLALAMTRKFSRSAIHPPGSLLRYARKDGKTNLAFSFG